MYRHISTHIFKYALLSLALSLSILLFVCVCVSACLWLCLRLCPFSYLCVCLSLAVSVAIAVSVALFLSLSLAISLHACIRPSKSEVALALGPWVRVLTVGCRERQKQQQGFLTCSIAQHRSCFHRDARNSVFNTPLHTLCEPMKRQLLCWDAHPLQTIWAYNRVSNV